MAVKARRNSVASPMFGLGMANASPKARALRPERTGNDNRDAGFNRGIATSQYAVLRNSCACVWPATARS